MRFEEVYGLREGERLKPTEPWRRNLVFGLRILDDYARTGSVVRFVVERSGLRIPLAMQKPMHDYEKFAKERRHLRMSSLQERMNAIAVFLDFLRSRGVMSLDRMQADDISAFITSRSCWKPRTVSHVASHLRLFLQFLFLRDILPRDFSSVVPTIRVARHDTVPSVWDQELVAKLLEVVDRNSPKVCDLHRSFQLSGSQIELIILLLDALFRRVEHPINVIPEQHLRRELHNFIDRALAEKRTVRSLPVVQLGNQTPIVSNHEESCIHGTHGTVVPRWCVTRWSATGERCSAA